MNGKVVKRNKEHDKSDKKKQVKEYAKKKMNKQD